MKKTSKKAPAKKAPKKQAPAKQAAPKTQVSAKQAAPKEQAPAKQATPKKQAPAKTSAPAKTAAGKGPLRGVALVDAALLARSEAGEITGLSPDEIAAIDLGDHKLSPALARWLALDGEMFTLGQPQSLAELLDSELSDWADAFVDLAKYLKGPCVLFEDWGSESRRFLYLGARDEHGEYPVFTIDVDDTPFACLNGPVDVWLSQHAGHLDDEEYYGFVPKAYEPARKALAAKCFGGYIAHVDGAFSKTLS